MAWTDLGAWTSRATITKTRLDQISDNFSELKAHTHDGTDGDGSAFAWAGWTPSYTGFSVSSSAVIARYTRIGKIVFGTFQIGFAGTPGWSGAFTVSLPVTAAYPSSASLAIGAAFLSDAGSDRYPAIGYLASNSTMVFLTDNITVVGSATPFTWANGDKIDITFMYEGT